MYKSILAILLVGLLAAPIMAQPFTPSPVPSFGWGTDCSYWDHHSGSDRICALHTAYDPAGPCDNSGWITYDDLNCGGQATPNINFAFAGSVELWVELYAEMCCTYNNWQFHILSDGPGDYNMYFWVVGSVHSNSELTIGFEGADGNSDMDLVYQENMLGVVENHPGIGLNYGYLAGNELVGPAPLVTQDNIYSVIYDDLFGPI
jgi:hypothetical protein